MSPTAAPPTAPMAVPCRVFCFSGLWAKSSTDAHPTSATDTATTDMIPTLLLRVVMRLLQEIDADAGG
jgi:hypothetical protein